jgi:hypothetical protein
MVCKVFGVSWCNIIFIEFRYVVLNHDNFVDGDFTVKQSSANSEIMMQYHI